MSTNTNDVNEPVSFDIIQIDKSDYGISSLNDLSFDSSTNRLSVGGRNIYLTLNYLVD